MIVRSDTDKPEWLTQLEKHGFSLERQLRGGITGEAAIVKYSGDDESIKKLCDRNGLIFVKIESSANAYSEADAGLSDEQKKKLSKLHKHAIASFQHEWNIVQKLESRNDSNQLSQKLRPRVAAKEFGGVKIIFNECVKSENLEEMMRAEGNRQLDKADDSHLAMFDMVFATMYMAQRALHKDGYFHLDSLPRNFMWPGIIIDFGASLEVGVEGNGLNDPRYKHIPANNYNQAAKSHREGIKSISTDLYNIKTGMVECLANYLGVRRSVIDHLYADVHLDITSTESENELDRENDSKKMSKPLGYRSDNESNSASASDNDENIMNDEFANIETRLSDREIDMNRLKGITSALSAHAENMKVDNDPRAKIVLAVIKKYSHFLTYMPDPAADMKHIMQDDKASFLRCNPVAKIDKTIGSMNIIAATLGLSRNELERGFTVAADAPPPPQPHASGVQAKPDEAVSKENTENKEKANTPKFG